MARKKSDTSPSELDVQAKMALPLTERLNKLITDTTALRKHLDCTSQTISQYRIGTARPSLENLCKIADFYGVSTDYLLGLSDTPSRKEDVQSACKTTGLTETAINKVKNFQNKAALSAVLESQKLFDLIKAIADSAKYAGNRGHLIAEHMMQTIQGKRVTVPGEDLDYIFLGKTIDATVKLFHEVSARLYNEKKKEE